MNVFEHQQTLAAPLDQMLEVLLSELPSLATLLPDIESIEPLGSRWILGRLERRDRWVGRPTSAFARWMLPAEAFSWVVQSLWQLEPFVVSLVIPKRSVRVRLP
jgi:hypothetical protein